MATIGFIIASYAVVFFYFVLRYSERGGQRREFFRLFVLIASIIVAFLGCHIFNIGLHIAVILGLLVYKPQKDILRVEIANSHIETELATAIMAKFGMRCVEEE